MLRLWLLLAAILWLGLSLSTIAFADYTGRVVGIIDGDTIEVLNGHHAERIRLSGIDCPEKGQFFGKRASRWMSSPFASRWRKSSLGSWAGNPRAEWERTLRAVRRRALTARRSAPSSPIPVGGLCQHPARHSARFPHPFLMLRLYGCTYFPTGRTLLNGIRSVLRRLPFTPASSQSLKKPGIGAWEFGLMVHLKQFTSRHHTCSLPVLATSHSEGFIWWRVRDDTHFLLTTEGFS